MCNTYSLVVSSSALLEDVGCSPALGWLLKDITGSCCWLAVSGLYAMARALAIPGLAFLCHISFVAAAAFNDSEPNTTYFCVNTTVRGNNIYLASLGDVPSTTASVVQCQCHVQWDDGENIHSLTVTYRRNAGLLISSRPRNSSLPSTNSNMTLKEENQLSKWNDSIALVSWKTDDSVVWLKVSGLRDVVQVDCQGLENVTESPCVSCPARVKEWVAAVQTLVCLVIVALMLVFLCMCERKPRMKKDQSSVPLTTAVDAV